MSAPDPAFPSLHIRPPTGWLNDPNGLIRIDGIYHVFFQYNPDAPTHGSIKWGHASSRDLLHWRDEPIALVNRPGEIDEAGCWSGTVVDDGGIPTAVYSALARAGGPTEVVLARSDRTLTGWEQDRRPVMRMPADPAITDVRDPFVFAFDGHRYAVQGAGGAHVDGRPQILAYACDDLRAWTELGPLLTDDDPISAKVARANIWECPNLFPLEDRWILLVSLWRRLDSGEHDLAGVRYLVGDLAHAGGGLAFEPSSGGVIDDGPTFYAPQVLVEPDRVLLWSWANEHGRTPAQVADAGWAGTLTCPRELYFADGELGSRPARELAGLRRERLAWQRGEGLAARVFELETSGPLQLFLAEAGTRALVADVAATPAAPGRILVDGSLIEIFCGPTSTTTRAYPTTTSTWAIEAAPTDVTAWLLGLSRGG